MDTSVSKFPRFVWPKQVPPLDVEQQRINDDFVRHWLDVFPKQYGAVARFNHQYPTRLLPADRPFKTLEIGAGLGSHIAYEDLTIQHYHCVELRPNVAADLTARYPRVPVFIGDCQKRTPYNDASFDRLIAIHVLEHLPNLPACLDEASRILKTGGVFSIVIPCDPGLAYKLARKISAERIFRKKYRMPYGWLISREHVNSPEEVLSELKKRFTLIDTSYFPLLIPSINANLCIGAMFIKTGRS